MSKYTSNFLNYKLNVVNQFCNDFAKQIEHSDHILFLQLQKEKPRIYVVNKVRSRTLITPFGKVTYRRRIYKYVESSSGQKRYVAKIDELWGIKKYLRYDENYCNEVIAKLRQKFGSFKTVALSFEYPTNKMQISRILARTLTPDLQTVYKPENKPENKNVYVNVDDTYVNLRINKKTKKHRIRMILLHQGKSNQGKLINARTYTLMQAVEHLKC